MAQTVRPPQFGAHGLLTASATGHIRRSLRHTALDKGVERPQQHLGRYARGELEGGPGAPERPADVARLPKTCHRRADDDAARCPGAQAAVPPHLLRGSEAPHGGRRSVPPDEQLATVGSWRSDPIPGTPDGLTQRPGGEPQRSGEIGQLVDGGASWSTLPRRAATTVRRTATITRSRSAMARVRRNDAPWVDRSRGSTLMRTIIFIVVAAIVVIGAIALGLKFFNTSISEEEDEKGWKD